MCLCVVVLNFAHSWMDIDFAEIPEQLIAQNFLDHGFRRQAPAAGSQKHVKCAPDLLRELQGHQLQHAQSNTPKCDKNFVAVPAALDSNQMLLGSGSLKQRIAFGAS